MTTKEPTPLPESQNIFVRIAKAANRDYVTPEDVGLAMQKHPRHKIQQDLLLVIGRREGIGLEDYSLCAFVASQPPTSPPPPRKR